MVHRHDHDTDRDFGYGGTKPPPELTNGHHKTEPDEPGITLERYAAGKSLPVWFLEKIGLRDATYDFNPAVRIPYPDGLGTREAYHRYRLALKKEPRFHAPPKHLGLEPIPYGLHVLGDARKAGYVWLPEGESDAQTLWFIDEPALGIPGVESWVKFGREWAKHLEGIPLLLVPVEHDPAGERFWTLLFSTEGIRDRVRRVKMTSPELKDANKLWKDAVECRAEEQFKMAVKGHVYLESRSRSLSRIGTGADGESSDFQPVRAVSFTSRSKPKAREWVVDQVAPKGHAMSWYGAGGMAKSFLALHFAISVASPDIHEWAGQKATTVPVVYGDFELDETEHLKRAQELTSGMGLEDVPLNFNYLGLTGLPTRQALAVAAEECERLGAGLFILDSVGYALAGDLELSRDVIKFFREEIQVIKNTGATPHLIDHQAKIVKGEKYSDKQEFGSVYKTNSVRSSFQLRGSWEGNTMTATFAHKKHNLSRGLDPFSLKLTFGDDKVSVEKLEEAEPDPDRQPTAKEKMLAAWKELGEATTEQAAEHTGLDPKTVRNLVKDLVDGDKLVDTKRKDGRFHIYAFSPGPDPTKGSGSGLKGESPTSNDTKDPQTEGFQASEGGSGGKVNLRLIVDQPGVEDLAGEIADSPGPIALDTETSGLDLGDVDVRLMQVKTSSGGTSTLVDCQAADPAPILEALVGKHVLGHNLPYDLAVLKGRYGYEHRGPVSDTQYMFRVYYGGTNKLSNLQDALKDLRGVEISKDHQDADWMGELSEGMIEYAALDVEYLHELRDALAAKIDKTADHLWNVVDLEHRIVKVTAHMKAVGMPVDEAVFAECVVESREGADKKLEELDSYVTAVAPLPEIFAKANAKNKNKRHRADKVNWDSPAQATWAFEAVAGIELTSTDKETLPGVDHPMAQALLDYRKALDVYKRFRATKVSNGRVHGDWDQLKARTGRMSCSKPPLQGIPDPLRRAFVAPAGKKLVISDLSQIEIRVLAAECGDENLKADLAAGRDVHRRVAASIFNKNFEDVSDRERKMAKALVFGTLYGLGLAGFTARVNAMTGQNYSRDEVERDFRQPLFKPYPKVQAWMENVSKEYEAGKKVSYTPMGRRRLPVPDVPAALNTPIQAGATDVMKAIADAAYEGLKDGWEISGIVHDEILLLVPGDDAANAKDWLHCTMTYVGGEVVNHRVPESRRVEVGASTKVCDTWAEKE